MLAKIVVKLLTKDVETFQTRVEVFDGDSNSRQHTMDVALELIQARVGSRRNEEDGRLTLVRPIGNTDSVDGLQRWLQSGTEDCDIGCRSCIGSTAEYRPKRHCIDRHLVLQRCHSLVPGVQDPLQSGVAGTLHRTLGSVGNDDIGLTVREGNLKREMRKKRK